MSNANVSKKTVIPICSVIAAVVIAMLLLIPIDKKNQLYEKWGSIAELAETDKRAQFIIDNEELYPENILAVLRSNSDKIDYVYNYPMLKDSYKTMSFTDSELNGDTVPAVYMSDPRWAYEDDGCVYQSGCAAVSLTMANLYLNHNSDVDPVLIMRYADQMGYYGLGGINETDICSIMDKFGMKYEERIIEDGGALTEAELKEAVNRESSVVMAAVHGDTFGNHAMIIRGCDENGYYINDPADEEKTAQTWDFPVFADELVRYWIIMAE